MLNVERTAILLSSLLLLVSGGCRRTKVTPAGTKVIAWAQGGEKTTVPGVRVRGLGDPLTKQYDVSLTPEGGSPLRLTLRLACSNFGVVRDVVSMRPDVPEKPIMPGPVALDIVVRENREYALSASCEPDLSVAPPHSAKAKLGDEGPLLERCTVVMADADAHARSLHLELRGDHQVFADFPQGQVAIR